MKVLQIALKPPFPEVDGGCKAIHSITQGLLDCGVEVKVLTISTVKHPFQKENIPASYIQKTQIEHRFVNTQVRPLGAFKNLFSSKSYNIERFYDKEFENLIVTTLQAIDYDIILLESIFLAKYVHVIRANAESKIVYRTHNVEHDIWFLNAAKQKGLKKWYLNYLAKKLKKAEIKTLLEVDGIASITEQDENRFKDLGIDLPITTIPFGINIKDYKDYNLISGGKVFHIGSMDWAPNQIGVKWFLENVWKNVVNENLTAELNLAGRGMPSWLINNKKLKVNVLGEVENAIDFINSNNIMIVPLLSGSGMRIKIIEGMALGKIVITTSIGASGIKVTNKKNIVIADTPTAFSNAINYYLEHPKEQIKIGESARQLMENEYDNSVIISRLIEFCKRLNIG